MSLRTVRRRPCRSQNPASPSGKPTEIRLPLLKERSHRFAGFGRFQHRPEVFDFAEDLLLDRGPVALFHQLLGDAAR